jgi:apolipoprotein N-acyltransferase
VLASAILLGLYARGGMAWVLGFVALVPWLWALDANRALGGALLRGWAMSLAFTVAAFAFSHSSSPLWWCAIWPRAGMAGR